MADFDAVIRRAVDGLENNTSETRAKVYDKARSAVLRQLKNMNPRPPEQMLKRQLAKLDAAILEVEAEQAVQARYERAMDDGVRAMDDGVAGLDVYLPDDEEPPILPEEPFGPSFAATDDGRIQIASSSPASQKDLEELGQTIVALIEATDDLISLSARSNAHNSITDIARSYREALVSPSGEIAIDLMYVRGVRLQNIARRIEMSSRSGDLPEMALRLGESLDTVVALHGLAVMSTDAGRKIVEKARSYHSRPEELEEMQRLGAVILNAMDSQNLLEPRTSAEMKALADDVADGFDTGLSAQAFRQTASNLLVWCTRAALSGFGMIAAEGFLQSQFGVGGVHLAQQLMDRVTIFLVEQSPVLLEMSALVSADLQWLPNALRVIKAKQLDTVVSDALQKVIGR